ncbi:hypothetical protein J2X69_002147 [Algoriphagus sp. 4150]|uniref:hypothetical protein n=1 Tax=Algoriphagus sp. 4150 TaxID=2817756 RepID=UPI002856CDCC|nr:hypothetical protein [Algoriphagus sp. 4150]MDR7129801.1 hypothetical protein [Algoriphagus sp. 4150]
MKNSFSLDPGYDIAKIFIRIGIIFCAGMVAILLYMVYLSYLGMMIDWDLALQASLGEFQPEANSTFLHMLFFSFPALGFLISIFVLGWLGKIINKESRTQHLVT